MHRASLWDVDREFADVLPLEQVLEYLRSAVVGMPTGEEG